MPTLARGTAAHDTAAALMRAAMFGVYEPLCDDDACSLVCVVNETMCVVCGCVGRSKGGEEERGGGGGFSLLQNSSPLSLSFSLSPRGATSPLAEARERIRNDHRHLTASQKNLLPHVSLAIRNAGGVKSRPSSTCDGLRYASIGWSS